MRVGILTYHRADNFGAVIQSYALLTYLRAIGHDAELIDYRCRHIEMRYDIWNPRILISRKNIFISFKEYISRFKSLNARKKRRTKFSEFRKKLPMSKRFCEDECLNRYDVVIVGSDQVWNFHMNKGSENVFLLDLHIPDYVKKIAYAASSELEGLLKINRSYLVRCLEDFDKISVREGLLRDKLKDSISGKIEVCLDPVFLLEKGIYEKLCVPDVCSKPFVLVYHMTYSAELADLARNEANSKNMVLIEIFGGFNHRDTPTIITSWGPFDVLSYIYNAETIYTTSFHGLAMSIIFEKNVWVYDIGSNSRQKNLLYMAGIEDRLLNKNEKISDNAIDYQAVRKNMKTFIDRSKKFLILEK